MDPSLSTMITNLSFVYESCELSPLTSCGTNSDGSVDSTCVPLVSSATVLADGLPDISSQLDGPVMSIKAIRPLGAGAPIIFQTNTETAPRTAGETCATSETTETAKEAYVLTMPNFNCLNSMTKIFQQRRKRLAKASPIFGQEGEQDDQFEQQQEKLFDEYQGHHLNLIMKKNDQINLLKEQLASQSTQSKSYEATIESQNEVIDRLKQQIDQEKELRLKQLRSLDERHNAEFEELEKEHTEFVSKLVCSYQREVDALKKEVKGLKSVIHERGGGSDAQELRKSRVVGVSSNEADAVAALSYLSSPSQFMCGVLNNKPLQTLGSSCQSSCNVFHIVETEAKSEGKSSCKRRFSEVSGGSRSDASQDKRQKFNDAQLLPDVSSKERPIQQSKKLKKQTRKPSRKISSSSKCSSTPSLNSTSTSKKSTKRCTLSPETVEYLKAWMMSPEHCDHPYPTEEEKAKIMEDTKIGINQLNIWFVNNRKRFWLTEVKPRVDELKKTNVDKK